MKLTKLKKQTEIEKEIDTQIDELRRLPASSKEYKDQLEILDRLYEIKAKEPNDRVSRNTLLTVGANLLGIGIILAYEQFGNVITTKALGFVTKTRL